MKRKRILVFALCFVLTLAALPAAAAPQKLAAHFIDVGQGDSIFIKLPNGQTMLIDAGEASAGKSVVKYLKAQKVKKIDYLIATHPHADHIGGMPQVIKAFDVGEVYAPKVVATTKTYESFLSAVKDKGLSIKSAKAGVCILSGKDLAVDIIAPVKDDYSDLNNASAVIKITYNKTSFLFMGDAEALSEKDITASVSADVIKVGHHGSNTSCSEAFLKKVSPKHAVISCGKKNSYGHPATQTLDALANAGAKIYRTDKSGTIVVTSTGTGIAVNKKPAAHTPSPPAATGAPATGGSSGTSGGAAGTDTQTQTVYITKTGKKYHRDGCSSLSRSKIAISLEKARKSYEPCKNCNPPK